MKQVFIVSKKGINVILNKTFKARKNNQWKELKLLICQIICKEYCHEIILQLERRTAIEENNFILNISAESRMEDIVIFALPWYPG